MKLTDEQRFRICKAMHEAPWGEDNTSLGINMLAAGMRELAEMPGDWNTDGWSGDVPTGDILKYVANELEAK